MHMMQVTKSFAREVMLEAHVDEVAAVLVASRAPGHNPRVDKILDFDVATRFDDADGVVEGLRVAEVQLRTSKNADDWEGALRTIRPPPDCSCPGLQPPDADNGDSDDTQRASAAAAACDKSARAAHSASCSAAASMSPALAETASKANGGGCGARASQSAVRGAQRAAVANRALTAEQHEQVLAAARPAAQKANFEQGPDDLVKGKAQALTKSQKKKQKRQRKEMREAQAAGKENVVV